MEGSSNSEIGTQGEHRAFYDQLVVTTKCATCAMCLDTITSLTKKYELARLLGITADEAFKSVQDYYQMHRDSHKVSRTHRGNGKHKGAFAFTVTKAPTDPYTVSDMLIAVRKVMSQKSCPVKRFAWYYEDKGKDPEGAPIHPHIHGMYETDTGGRIECKHWKRAWPIWDEKIKMGSGFRGGYHREVRTEEAYSDYIKKDAPMHHVFGVEDNQTV